MSEVKGKGEIMKITVVRVSFFDCLKSHLLPVRPVDTQNI